MEGFSETAKVTTKWKSKHFFCQAGHNGHPNLKAADIHEPSTDWGARVINPAHVQVLMKSFCDHGSVNDNIQIAVVDQNLYDRWQKSIKDGKPEDAPTLMELRDSEEKMRAFAGDHTRDACQKLALKHPHGRPWTQLQPDIYLCPPTHETNRLLRMLGRMDNQKAGVLLEQGYNMMVLQTHAHIEQERKACAGVKGLFQVVMREMRGDMVEAYKASKSVMVQIIKLATSAGPLWERLEKVFTGECKSSSTRGSGKRIRQVPFVIPMSGHFFSAMASLPDEDICELLDQVIDGELTLQQFRAETVNLRFEYKIKNYIIDYIDQTFGFKANSNHPDVTWATVEEQYPNVGRDPFWQAWMGHVVRAGLKTEPPTALADAVSATIKRAKLQAVTFVDFVVCGHTFVVVLEAEGCRRQR
jgi:hypothetical protein